MTSIIEAAEKLGAKRAGDVAQAIAETASSTLAEGLQAEANGSDVKLTMKNIVKQLAFAAPLAALIALIGKRSS